MQQVQPQGMLIYNRIAPTTANNLAALDSPALNLLSVKYIIAGIEIDRAAHPQLKQVYRDESVWIYENSQARPRVYLASADASGALTPSMSEAASVTITESRGIQVSINAKTDVPAALVLSDSYFPGWRAYIRPQGTAEDQEKEVPISVAAGNFRRVDLDAGAWTVRFRYSPPTFQIGAFTTFMAIVVIVFAVLMWLWRLFYTESQGEASGMHRVAKNSIAPIILNLFNRAIDFAFA